MRKSKLKGKKYWQVKLQEKAEVEGWLFVSLRDAQEALQVAQTIEDNETVKVQESAVVAEPSGKAAHQ